MRNIGIDNLDKKDVDTFTSDLGLTIRRKIDKPFKKLCNIFTGANIIRRPNDKSLSDEEYFQQLSLERVPISEYDLKKGKNNIVLERYPDLEQDESYIFVCNHTCPEDIETVLNIIDRNAYLVLGSIESLKYNPEMYLSWLNGMIPFDIMDQKQRKELMDKMKRVLKRNSILIFPEGSHNYSPNKIINNLFDGPVNLSLETGKKIVVVTLIKDGENSIAYIDVGNPIDLKSFGIQKDESLPEDEKEKQYVKSLTSCIRDKMATAAFHIVVRHFDEIKRESHDNIEEYLRRQKVEDAFKKLKWNHDVFDAEYLVKRTKEDKEYEEVIRTLSSLRYSLETIRKLGIDSREFIEKERDIDEKTTETFMRNHWLQTKDDKPKQLIK